MGKPSTGFSINKFNLKVQIQAKYVTLDNIFHFIWYLYNSKIYYVYFNEITLL